MGYENTNSVPRGRHAAKCYTELSVPGQAKKKLSMKITHSEIPLNFLGLSFIECSSIESLSYSVPGLVTFLVSQWVAFHSVGF